MKIETNEQLQECIEAMREVLKQGEIESRCADGTWVSVTGMGICADSRRHHRLKPKPIEGWIARGTILYSKCPDPRKAGSEYIRVREVIE